LARLARCDTAFVNYIRGPVSERPAWGQTTPAMLLTNSWLSLETGRKRPPANGAAAHGIRWAGIAFARQSAVHTADANESGVRCQRWDQGECHRLGWIWTAGPWGAGLRPRLPRWRSERRSGDTEFHIIRRGPKSFCRWPTASQRPSLGAGIPLWASSVVQSSPLPAN